MGIYTVVAAATYDDLHVVASNLHGASIWSEDAIAYRDINPEHYETYGDEGPARDGYIASDGLILSNHEAWSTAERNGFLDKRSGQAHSRDSAEYYALAGSEYDLRFARAAIQGNLKLLKKRAKIELEDAVFHGGDSRNRMLYEIVEDYLVELPFLERTDDGTKVLTERLMDVAGR